MLSKLFCKNLYEHPSSCCRRLWFWCRHGKAKSSISSLVDVRHLEFGCGRIQCIWALWPEQTDNEQAVIESHAMPSKLHLNTNLSPQVDGGSIPQDRTWMPVRFRMCAYLYFSIQRLQSVGIECVRSTQDVLEGLVIDMEAYTYVTKRCPRRPFCRYGGLHLYDLSVDVAFSLKQRPAPADTHGICFLAYKMVWRQGVECCSRFFLHLRDGMCHCKNHYLPSNVTWLLYKYFCTALHYADKNRRNIKRKPYKHKTSKDLHHTTNSRTHVLWLRRSHQATASKTGLTRLLQARRVSRCYCKQYETRALVDKITWFRMSSCQ